MMIQVLNRYPKGDRLMLVRYWQPWREIEGLRRQIDQVFDELTHADQPTAQPTAWSPAVELKDAGDSLVLRAQIPGVDAKDVDVQVAKQAVSISGEYRHEQKTEENGYFKSEFRYGKFQRVVPLPIGIENDQVQADYKDGILTLTLPKVAEARNRVVKINLAELNQTSAETSVENSTEAESTHA